MEKLAKTMGHGWLGGCFKALWVLCARQDFGGILIIKNAKMVPLILGNLHMEIIRPSKASAEDFEARILRNSGLGYGV